MSDDPDSNPGWDAINEALRPLYGETEPLHFGTVMKWMMGGNDPLDGTSVYWREAKDGAAAHWHYVSYGLTELYAKETDVPEVSGYGFELTFRLARPARDEKPPVWPIGLMQNLARYVFQSGNVFGPGHHLDANGPIALGEQTKLTAILFADDPELPPRDTPHGRMRFLQIVGITHDELTAVQGWNSKAFTELLAERSALLVSDLARDSMLDDASVARTVAERSAEEGSSMNGLYVSHWQWERAGTKTRIEMDAMAAEGVLKQLAGRLAHAQPLFIFAPGDRRSASTAFRAATESSVTVADARLEVALAPAAVESLSATLFATRGTYRIAELPDLELEVVPTEIKDRDGNVLEVVG